PPARGAPVLSGAPRQAPGAPVLSGASSPVPSPPRRSPQQQHRAAAAPVHAAAGGPFAAQRHAAPSWEERHWAGLRDPSPRSGRWSAVSIAAPGPVVPLAVAAEALQRHVTAGSDFSTSAAACRWSVVGTAAAVRAAPAPACAGCGASLTPDSLFCRRCGMRQGTEASPRSPPETPPQFVAAPPAAAPPAAATADAPPAGANAAAPSEGTPRAALEEAPDAVHAGAGQPRRAEPWPIFEDAPGEAADGSGPARDEESAAAAGGGQEREAEAEGPSAVASAATMVEDAAVSTCASPLPGTSSLTYPAGDPPPQGGAASPPRGPASTTTYGTAGGRTPTGTPTSEARRCPQGGGGGAANLPPAAAGGHRPRVSSPPAWQQSPQQRPPAPPPAASHTLPWQAPPLSTAAQQLARLTPPRPSWAQPGQGTAPPLPSPCHAVRVLARSPPPNTRAAAQPRSPTAGWREVPAPAQPRSPPQAWRECAAALSRAVQEGGPSRADGAGRARSPQHAAEESAAAERGALVRWRSPSPPAPAFPRRDAQHDGSALGRALALPAGGRQFAPSLSGSAATLPPPGQASTSPRVPGCGGGLPGSPPASVLQDLLLRQPRLGGGPRQPQQQRPSHAARGACRAAGVVHYAFGSPSPGSPALARRPPQQASQAPLPPEAGEAVVPAAKEPEIDLWEPGNGRSASPPPAAARAPRRSALRKSAAPSARAHFAPDVDLATSRRAGDGGAQRLAIAHAAPGQQRAAVPDANVELTGVCVQLQNKLGSMRSF
ncbi:unnamed protein product, partial [Prorocentrum cordatum]